MENIGLPAQAPEAYRRSSVLEYADRLRRPLLLIHGTADDNVYFLHSLKLADAWFRLGRPVEFATIANTTHLARRNPETGFALERRTAGFFDAHVRNRR